MDYHHLLNLKAFAILALPLLSYFLLIKRFVKQVKTPPEAAGAWPIIGHLRLLAGPDLLHIKLGAMADKYGPMFTIRCGVRRLLVVSNRDIAKELFTTHDLAVSSRPKSAAGRLLNYDYTAFGFSPYNKYWREMRKFLALELLSHRSLNLLKPIKASVVEGSVKQLYRLWTMKKSEGAGHVTVEMNKWIGDLNLSLMLTLVSGKRSCSGEDDREEQRVRDTVKEFFKASGILTVGDALPFLRWLDLHGHERKMKKAAADMDTLVAEWVEEHRRETKESKDFTDILLPALHQMDLDGHNLHTVAKATLITLLAGGTETITITITWTLALLLNNTDKLAKLQQELRQHIGTERLVMESDIEHLVYLQALVKESFRLYPAGPLAVMRAFREACTVGGYHVPKGTELVVNLWKLQTDPSVWSDPLEFKPERFLETSRFKDVDVKGQHFELIPFGAGRRACPGISLGVEMTQFVVATVVQAFELARPTSAPIDMTSSQRITNNKDSLQILLKPRLPSNVYL